MVKIGIIGGGISGLSAAHYLSKLGKPNIEKIVLFEASDRLGGWIQTSRFQDGSLFEAGPRSVRPIGLAAQTTLSLVEEVGLSDELISIPRSHPAAKNRMIYANGRLSLLPNSLTDLFKVKPPLTKRLLTNLIKEISVPKSLEEDESVYDFFKRRFGDEVAKYFIDSMCLGIFAGDSKKLSLRSCFKDLWNMEQKSGSLLLHSFFEMFAKKNKNLVAVESLLAKKAKAENWAVWSFKEGLEELPKAIGRSLQRDVRVEIRKNHPVSRIKFNAASNAVIHSQNETEEFDQIISSIYAPHLADILPSNLESIKRHLRSIPAVDVAVLNIEFSGNHIPYPAFGYLVPSSEKSKILGVIFDSCLFEKHNDQSQSTTRLTCMMGGAYFEQNFGKVDEVKEEVLVKAALNSLAEHLGIHKEPSRICLRIHKNCIPQYHVGHHSNLQNLRREISQEKLPLSLIGSSYDGVAINDCVLGGKIAAEKISNF